MFDLPYKIFMKIYKRRKNPLPVMVNFVKSHDKYSGYTFYNESKNNYQVMIVLGDTPFEVVCETLIHEFAHILAYPTNGHGKKFKKYFKKMGMEFSKKILEQYNIGELITVLWPIKE
jgi:ribosomal protein L21E